MQNTFVKVVLGIIAVVLLGVGAAALALPRIIHNDAFQNSLREKATEVLGAPVAWQSMDAALLPPRLVVSAPFLAGTDKNSEDARVTAESVDLRLALIPLFRGEVVVDSLVLRGLEVVVTRTADGLILPVAVTSSGDAGAASRAEADGSEEGVSAVHLAVRRFVISGGRILVVDRTFAVPVEWRLEDFEFAATGQAAGQAAGDSAIAPLDIALSAQLQTDQTKLGKIEATGTASLSGVYDLDVQIKEFALAALQPYLTEAASTATALSAPSSGAASAASQGGSSGGTESTLQLSGILSGRVSMQGDAAELAELDVDVEIAELVVRALGLELAGGLSLAANRVGTEAISFSAAVDVGAGGKADAKGTMGRDGAIDAAVNLSGLELAPFARLAGEGMKVSGLATGAAVVATNAEGELRLLVGDLRIPSIRYADDSLKTDGDLNVNIALEGEAPIRISAGLALSDGGQLDINGTSTRSGVLDLRADFSSFDLAMAKGFLPDPQMELAGLATGNGRLTGAAASPKSLDVEIDVVRGLLRVPDYFVDGPFHVKLSILSPLSDRPRGKMTLDLTDAEVDYQGQFTKRAGMRAEMTTTFTSKTSGEIVFESRIKLRNVDEIILQGAVGKSTHVSATTPKLELTGWSEVFPALLPYEASGVVQLDGIGVELLESAPSRFSGRIGVENVKLLLPDAGQVQLRGAIVGEQTRLRTSELQLLTSGATIGIKGTLEEPLGAKRFEFAVESIGAAEANDIISAFPSTRDTVFGALQMSGNIKGAAATGGDLYSSLEGVLSFSIGKNGGGRLRGRSLLQTILDQIPLVGGAARLTQTLRSGESLNDYLGDHFEIIEGDFEIGEGNLNARKFRIAYDGYEANLTGAVRMRDLQIDMTGEVLLKPNLISALGGGLSGGGGPARQPIRIPLARVTNTLMDPKVSMTPATLVAVPRLLIQSGGLDALTTGVGRVLGRVLGGSGN